MIEPTPPLPTTTTSTDFNFVADISAFLVAVALDDDVLRKAFRIDRHLTGLDVEHADGFGVVRRTACEEVAVLAGWHAGEAEQLPTHFVAVAAVQRIGEIPSSVLRHSRSKKNFDDSDGSAISSFSNCSSRRSWLSCASCAKGRSNSALQCWSISRIAMRYTSCGVKRDW